MLRPFEHSPHPGDRWFDAARGKVAGRADLIAVPGNPLNEIRVMEDVHFMMKQGVIYKEE